MRLRARAMAPTGPSGATGADDPSDLSDRRDETSAGTPGRERNAIGLASHIQSLGWDEQDFSDVVVVALGKVGRPHSCVIVSGGHV